MNQLFMKLCLRLENLKKIFDVGLLLESVRDGKIYKSFIPHDSIKSVNIF